MVLSSLKIMPSKSFNLVLSNKIASYKKKIFIDSDKSISIRSFLIGSISHNITQVNNVLESEDVPYRDYEFTIDNLPSFKYFSIKVIGNSTNQAYPPRIKEFSAIALA